MRAAHRVLFSTPFVAGALIAAISCSDSTALTPVLLNDAAADVTTADSGAALALITAGKCRDCHGSDLSGSTAGLASRGYPNSYAKNLTPDPDTGIATWTFDDFRGAVTQGIDDEGASLCAPMPKFSVYSEADLRAMYDYIHALPAVKHDVPDSVCGTDADAGDASRDAATEGG